MGSGFQLVPTGDESSWTGFPDRGNQSVLWIQNRYGGRSFHKVLVNEMEPSPTQMLLKGILGQVKCQDIVTKLIADYKITYQGIMNVRDEIHLEDKRVVHDILRARARYVRNRVRDPVADANNGPNDGEDGGDGEVPPEGANLAAQP